MAGPKAPIHKVDLQILSTRTPTQRQIVMRFQQRWESDKLSIHRQGVNRAVLWLVGFGIPIQLSDGRLV